MMGRRRIVLLVGVLLPALLRADGFFNAEPVVPHRRPLLETVLYGQLPNLLVWSANRFAFRSGFAFTSGYSVADNFHVGPRWDNDLFGTNFLGHPYHGSLYFNAARSGGYSFWESAPFTLAGSFVWEFFCETDPPSTNDLLTTTFGGIALGETGFRISNALFDGRSRGFGRVLREVAGTAVSPMGGLRRLVSGAMFRREPAAKRRIGRTFPVVANLWAGARTMHRAAPRLSGKLYPTLRIGIRYGDPFDERNRTPYDYFTLVAELNFFSGQPLLGKLDLTGTLWSRSGMRDDGRVEWAWGFFQHFAYYESRPLRRYEREKPYLFSETASLGAGFLSEGRFGEERWRWSLENHLSGVLLGGTQSAHETISGRDYAFGSGYSFRLAASFGYDDRVSLSVSVYGLHLFTWKGRPDRLYAERGLALYADMQGVRGNNFDLCGDARLTCNLTPAWAVQFDLTMTGRQGRFPGRSSESSLFYACAAGIRYRFR